MAPVSRQAAVANARAYGRQLWSGAVTLAGVPRLLAVRHAYGAEPSPIPGCNASEIMHTMRLAHLTMARLGDTRLN